MTKIKSEVRSVNCTDEPSDRFSGAMEHVCFGYESISFADTRGYEGWECYSREDDKFYGGETSPSKSINVRAHRRF